MVDKLDAFIEESKKLIGKEDETQPLVNQRITLRWAVYFARSLGIYNSLYNDPWYAGYSRYSCLLTPQTFLATVRAPASEGPYRNVDYGLAKFFTGAAFEWFNVLKVTGDTFTAELKLKDVRERPFFNKERAADLVSEACYCSQQKELLGTCQGKLTFVPLDFGNEMLNDREIYKYTEDDVKKITNDLDSEVSRGMETLYWEEVNEGDTLTPVVKGPAGLSDIMSWREVAYNVDYGLKIGYRRALKEVGTRRVNPTTNWPYWREDQTWDDWFSSKASGMPLPWVYGLHRVCLAEDLLTKWMSDDGFIRRLNLEILQPFFYQDVNWYKGEVTDKYKEKIGDVTYKAVDIKIEVNNQLGEKTAAGGATIYLPSRGRPVKLPIPQ